MKRLWNGDPREGRRGSCEIHAIGFGPISPKFSGACVVTGRARGSIKQIVRQARRRSMKQRDHIDVADEVSWAEIQAEMLSDFFRDWEDEDDRFCREGLLVPLSEGSCYEPDELYSGDP
ncbi:MAG: hypothetical protein WCW14_04595, partial [Candidatus Paceibacterota bacterium]